MFLELQNFNFFTVKELNYSFQIGKFPMIIVSITSFADPAVQGDTSYSALKRLKLDQNADSGGYMDLYFILPTFNIY